LTATAVPGAKDLRWWPQAPSLTSDHSLWFAAFVADRLLLRSTPVGGTLGINSGKFDFGFLFAGQALSFPQAGPFESAARWLRQIEFSRIFAE
jgi:hypothetical protein